VRARVAVTIEGQVRGLQTIEDRFLLVRASSSEDAVARLASEWRAYSRPYLNRDGRIVRWLLDEIIDVYDVPDDEIRPEGTEVYSKLSARRLPVRMRRGSRRRTTRS
jgi:hypothetical protein